jgi:hypothetical protein
MESLLVTSIATFAAFESLGDILLIHVTSTVSNRTVVLYKPRLPLSLPTSQGQHLTIRLSRRLRRT